MGPTPVLLSALKIGSRFFTIHTRRPGIYRGPYAPGGLRVEWEDNNPKPIAVHRNFKAIPAEWDNLAADSTHLQKIHLSTELTDAPGADYVIR